MKNTIIISNKPYLKEDEDEPPSCIIQQPDISFFAEADSHEKSLTLTNHDEFWNDWKWQFRHRISTVDELSQYVPLSDTEKTQLKLVTIKYPLSITPYYLSLINPLDPNDPIKKQAIPSFEEIALSDIGEEDPLAEHKDSAVPGLVHRYPDRVLMVLTNLCPMLCRHCTRKREWRHGVWVRTSEQIESMLDYVRRHKEVRDVILSGGDPLTLSTQHLERVISRLRQINHVEIIRIGSRSSTDQPC